MAKIKIISVDKIPLCPYCEKELDTIEQVSKGFFPQQLCIFVQIVIKY